MRHEVGQSAAGSPCYARRMRSDGAQHTMLLIGIKISFTKKPMKPMIAKPIVVACAIFENSATRARQAE